MRQNPDNIMNQSLDELARAYIENKSELDSYKKICEEENTAIKQKMAEKNLIDYVVGEKRIHRTIVTSYTVNDDMMLQVLKEAGYTECVKTKEYVDSEALENILYHLPKEEAAALAQKLDRCKTPKEVVQLKILKKK